MTRRLATLTLVVGLVVTCSGRTTIGGETPTIAVEPAATATPAAAFLPTPAAVVSPLPSGGTSTLELGGLTLAVDSATWVVASDGVEIRIALEDGDLWAVAPRRSRLVITFNSDVDLAPEALIRAPTESQAVSLLEGPAAVPMGDVEAVSIAVTDGTTGSRTHVVNSEPGRSFVLRTEGPVASWGEVTAQVQTLLDQIRLSP